NLTAQQGAGLRIRWCVFLNLSQKSLARWESSWNLRRDASPHPADVAPEPFVIAQNGHRGCVRELARLNEDEALANFLQYFELPARRRMQAHEHYPAVGAQVPEMIKHEPDIAVLCVELWLVKQVDGGGISVGAIERKILGRPVEGAHLVWLEGMKGQPRERAITNALD